MPEPDSMAEPGSGAALQPLRVVFAGTPEFAAVALQALIASRHDVVGVLTQPDRPAGRGRKLTPSPVKRVAEAAELVVQQPLSLKEADAQSALASLAGDVLVVAAYGLILPSAVLALPRLGCLNIHASLLPRWRGAAPLQRAILAGDAHTGVCIMQMDAGLDTGDVLLARRLPITDDMNTAALHDALAPLGAEALLQVLDLLASPDGAAALVASPQPEAGVTYAAKLAKAEARLDFHASTDTLHRQIRAFNPWPVAEALLLEERVRLWRSRRVPAAETAAFTDHSDTRPVPGCIVAVTGDALRVTTGDGLLDLLELQWPGKPKQAAVEFTGQRPLSGAVFNAGDGSGR